MLTASDVAAVLVTRGNVDLAPILETLPYEVVVWDNSRRPADLAAFGRYVAIQETRKRVVYFQDDDCLVTCHDQLLAEYEPGKIVANMPAHRKDYTDTVLIGWGSLFDRELPAHAFARWGRHYPSSGMDFWRIGADFVFPMLTPWKRVDLGFEHLPYASANDRTWRSEGYDEIKAEFLQKAREVRDLR